MLELRSSQSQSTDAEGSSSSNPIDIDECKIMDEVLGTHRAHQKGVGRKLNNSLSSSSTAAYPQRGLESTIPQDVQDYLRQTQEYLDSVQRDNEERERYDSAQAQRIQHIEEALARIVPGYRMSAPLSRPTFRVHVPPPLPSRFAPQQSPQAQPSHSSQSSQQPQPDDQAHQ